ncbi:hypothetical protein D3C71_1616080 [compost metagenome]
MLEVVSDFAVPWVRDRRAAEVQRVAVIGQHHFHGVGVAGFVCFDRVAQGADLHARIGEHADCKRLDVRRTHQRLITLQVDVDVCLDLGHDFGQAVGAGWVIRRGHDALAAKRPHRLRDAFIVGSHHDHLGIGDL